MLANASTRDSRIFSGKIYPQALVNARENKEAVGSSMKPGSTSRIKINLQKDQS